MTILAVKYKFYDKERVQISPLIGQVLLYSTVSTIILIAFPYHKPIANLFEAIASKFGFIKYNEWEIQYSALWLCHTRSFLV